MWLAGFIADFQLFMGPFVITWAQSPTVFTSRQLTAAGHTDKYKQHSSRDFLKKNKAMRARRVEVTPAILTQVQ